MSVFTCINCNVRFASADIQRQHYKSDWHRYNLKRRVADLPPVTAEQFQERVLQIRNAEIGAIEEKQTTLYCNACRKQFNGQKAHDNHLGSHRHRQNLKRFTAEHSHDDAEGSHEVTTKTMTAQKSHHHHHYHHPMSAKEKKGPHNGDENSDEYTDVSDDAGDDEMDSDEWEICESPLNVNECLFCATSSDDLVDNLKHMSVAHSFFIPDMDYCVDPEGLVGYLGEKVARFFVCLWCNDRGRTFYSLDAVRKHMHDKGHCQMYHEGVALAEYADYYDYSSSYPDHDEAMDIDEEVVPDLLDGDEYQLVLPSGAVIGHRSLLRYYKQRLHAHRGVAVVPKKSEQRKLHKVLNEYRSLGWTTTQQNAAARRARDIHLMKRVQSKWEMKLGVKANKLQKHFRLQVLV